MRCLVGKIKYLDGEFGHGKGTVTVPNGKKYVAGGTKLIVENDKLKDLKIEKPLDNFDLENCLIE